MIVGIYVYIIYMYIIFLYTYEYFKELAYAFRGAGKSKISKAGRLESRQKLTLTLQS